MTVDAAALLLDRPGWKVRTLEDGLEVCYRDGPTLRIFLRSGETVLRDAVRIGGSSVYADFLSRCDCRIEITFSDLNAMLLESNTLIETQSTLQDATDGLVFNTWNESLSHPNIKRPSAKKRSFMAGRVAPPTHEDYT